MLCQLNMFQLVFGALNAMAARYDKTMLTQKTIVEDYCKIHDIEPPSDDEKISTDLYDKALRHIHALILRDMSSPFAADAYQVREPNTLHAYSRATFLRWDKDTSTTVFGCCICETFMEEAEQHGLKFVGVVGRPLYACGARLPDSVSSKPANTGNLFCMNVASMFPLLEFKGEKQSWRCAECAHAGIHAETSRRMMKLYPLVRTKAGHQTPMRAKLAVAALHAPPDEFNWKNSSGQASRISTPALHDFKTTFATFTRDESKAVWLSSTSYM